MLREFELEEFINQQYYKGVVTVDTESETVNLNSLDETKGTRAYVDGCFIATVGDILKATAFAKAGLFEDVLQCSISKYWGFKRDMVELHSGDLCFSGLAICFDDEYYPRSECEEHSFRDACGEHWLTAPESFWDNCYYCNSCRNYVSADDFSSEELCVFCEEEDTDETEQVIQGYTESHRGTPVYFGEYQGQFSGLGFELEVDCSSSQAQYNNAVAAKLAENSGLEQNEIRFAYDGSLNNGFEIISQPHTVKEFWNKQNSWKRMLKVLAEEGYQSHDTNTCGLHVHVSRTMFGKTEQEQDLALSKVYQFFDENWENIVKVSRRKNFYYCEKNEADDDYDEDLSSHKKWHLYAKDKKGSHYVALNNTNRATFEFRLGRGTLNSWSFFSWIDLLITICKNSRRITVSKVESNDLLSWLGGIKESTAKYIYKRGAWRSSMLALFPNIEWETDLTEN